MFDIVLDTLMLPIEREVAADIRKRLSSLSWRPNQIAVGSVHFISFGEGDAIRLDDL